MNTEIILGSDDIPQILRYLGYRNTGLTEADERNISDAIELTNTIIKPSGVWKLYSLQYLAEGILLLPAGVHGKGPAGIQSDGERPAGIRPDGNVTADIRSDGHGTADIASRGLCRLTGESIRKHLNGVTKAVLLAVTIGRDFDMEVEKAMVRNPSFGVILNACGIQAVERYADTLQLEIDKRLAEALREEMAEGQSDKSCSGTTEGQSDKSCAGTAERSKAVEKVPHTGIRFSPGYGDLPLETQRDFIRLLDATRKAGITLNESCLMNPLKSVTAIAGVEPAQTLTPGFGGGRSETRG